MPFSVLSLAAAAVGSYDTSGTGSVRDAGTGNTVELAHSGQGGQTCHSQMCSY